MISIAVASFKEVIRKKLFLLVGAVTLIYLVIFSLITHYAVQDMNRHNLMSGIDILLTVSQIISLLGFYFSSMLVAFLTVISSVGAVSSEIESGIIHSIVTRPLKRTHYILGKYLGNLVLLISYSTFLYLSILIICFTMKLPFINSLGISAFIKGFLFFTLEPVAILSLSIFCSSVFKTLTSGILVSSIYILGLIGGMMEQIGSMIKNDSLFKLGILSSLVSPFDIIYRDMLLALFSSVGMTNPLFGPAFFSSTVPSKWMTLYIFLYIFGLMFLAIRKFKKRDIG